MFLFLVELFPLPPKYSIHRTDISNKPADTISPDSPNATLAHAYGTEYRTWGKLTLNISSMS